MDSDSELRQVMLKTYDGEVKICDLLFHNPQIVLDTVSVGENAYIIEREFNVINKSIDLMIIGDRGGIYGNVEVLDIE